MTNNWVELSASQRDVLSSDGSVICYVRIQWFFCTCRWKFIFFTCSNQKKRLNWIIFVESASSLKCNVVLWEPCGDSGASPRVLWPPQSASLSLWSIVQCGAPFSNGRPAQRNIFPNVTGGIMVSPNVVMELFLDFGKGHHIEEKPFEKGWHCVCPCKRLQNICHLSVLVKARFYRPE